MTLRLLASTALASALLAAAPAGAQTLFSPFEDATQVVAAPVRTATGILAAPLQAGVQVVEAPLAIFDTGDNLQDFRAEALRNDALAIESGRIALRRSRDAQVRALARRTIRDRQATTAALLPAGTSLSPAGNVVSDRGDGSPVELLSAPITLPINLAGRIVGGQDLIESDRAVQGRRVVLDPRRQGSLNTLASASGRAFNGAYAAQQVVADREEVALYSGYAQAGEDPNGRVFAQRTLPNRQRGLQAAQRVASRYVVDEPAF